MQLSKWARGLVRIWRELAELQDEGSKPSGPALLRTKFNKKTGRIGSHTCIIHVSEDEYKKYLKSLDQPLRDNTIQRYWIYANDYIKTHDTISEDYVKTYLSKFDNSSTYNNHLKSLIHLARMYGTSISVKMKRIRNESLITAPSYEAVKHLIEGIQDIQVKSYLALCASSGIRVERLFNLTWNDIDFDSGFVLRKIEHIRTKNYRPNPLHRDVGALLDKLQRTEGRIFTVDPKTVRHAIREMDDKTTPTMFRDFFYNQALTCGMNSVLVEWLMGHDIGIAKHYLADNIKQEYRKFEEAIRFAP